MDGSSTSDGMPPGDPGADTIESPPLALPERVALQRVANNLLARRHLIRVGRYEVTRDLGRGGCGVVSLARDPRLGRDVAIKLVLPTMSRGKERASWQARLLREARTLARLVHPNVVQIFDVGRDGDGVFLVMEHLQGHTLRSWQKTELPTVAEVLDAYLQAARGLQAAHASGVVHRDFKPDNVMIDEAGVVKVIDFGLAREGRPISRTDSLDAESGSLEYGSALTDGGVTRTGRVVGSPAYMAPEQHAGQASEPASDQFAFCVALFEALHGARPFRGEDLRALEHNKAAGNLVMPRRRRAVPAAVTRALRRGLAADPRERFASMEHLMRALQRGRGGSGRLRAAAGLGLAAVVLVAGLARPSPEQRRCNALAQQRQTSWNEERQAALQTAMAERGTATASSTWARTQAGLQRWANRWDRTRAEVCDASDAAVPGALPCLERSLAEARALLGVFERSDAAVVEQSVSMVEALGDPRHCESPDGAPHLVERIDVDHWARLSKAKWLVDAGQYERARAQALGLSHDARRAGESDVELRAMLVLARVHDELEEHVQAQRMFVETMDRARRAGLDAVAAQAGIGAAGVATSLGDLAQAEQLTHQAQALVDRAGNPPSLQVRLLEQSAYVARIASRPDRAQALLTEALSLLDPQTQPVARAKLLGNLATAEFELDQVAAASVHVEEAIALFRRELGPHPHLAKALCDLGRYRAIASRLTEAREHLTDCIDMSTDLPGAQRTLFDGKQTMSAILISADRLDESVALQREALDGLTALYGSDHPDVSFAAFRLARLYMQLEEDPQKIVDLVVPAAAALERAYGPDSPWLGSTHNLLGHAFRLKGDFEAASRHYERALQLDLGNALHRSLVLDAYLGLAELDKARGDLDEAAARLQEGMSRLEAMDTPPPLIRLALMMTIAKLEQSRGRLPEAAQAARQALAGLAQSGSTDSEPADMLDIVVAAAYEPTRP